jgi:dephospho-CoA kinase
MRTIGLTGGIASGKSTVAKMLAELGAHVVDADQIAREVVQPGHPAFDEIVATFGKEVIGEDGNIARKKLAAVVFDDHDKRRALNAITHPRIAAATQEKLVELGQSGVPVAIYEAALLVENKIHLGLDGLIVVSVDEPTQVKRVMERDELDEAAAQKRIHAQAALAEKLEVADFVIDTSKDLASTKKQVEEVWRRIESGEPKRL